jgi:hypothetical protein
VLGIDEAEAFSECLTRELRALDNANVLAFLESEPLVDEVSSAKKPIISLSVLIVLIMVSSPLVC